MAPPRPVPSSLSLATSTQDEPSPQEGESRRRVPRACDRCRLKKIKCDGQMPCTRCSVENNVCRYGERPKTSERRIPPGYVEYLEEQQQLLVKALKKCWALTDSAEAGASEDTSIHTILDSLGVLADFPLRQHRGSGFNFEEDLDRLQKKCEAEDLGAAMSSASTTTSHVASAQQTPFKQSPEPDTTSGFPFSQANPFQQIRSQSIPQQRPSPAISSASSPYLTQVSSAPTQTFESPADVYYNPHPQWNQPSLSQVQSEPSISAPTSYWPQPQPPPWHAQGDQGFSTVNPNDLVLANVASSYFQSQEELDEYYRQMQDRHHQR